jgi:rhodanese-related sulfurtransferase
MTVISPTELPNDHGYQLIDVRTPDEFRQEAIPGSRNIPLAQLEQHYDELVAKPVLLTCRTGNRANEAKKRLEALGHQNLSVLQDGLSGWKKAGKPTVSVKKGFSIMQQVQIIAGSLILVGSFIKPLWFLAPIAGFGLLTAGLTNTCLMASLLAKAPWNSLPPATQQDAQESCPLQ